MRQRSSLQPFRLARPLLTDASEETGNDIRARCRTQGQEIMASADIDVFIQSSRPGHLRVPATDSESQGWEQGPLYLGRPGSRSSFNSLRRCIACLGRSS